MQARLKLPMLVCATLTALPATAAAAGHDTWAQVLQADPVRQQVRIPVETRECRDVEVYRTAVKQRSTTPMILGAIIGGVVGNQFGGGSGRDLMTMAGATLGASVAADHQRQQQAARAHPTLERRCELRTDWQVEERIVGWDVTYEIDGRIYQARVTEPPTDRIRVRLEAHPVP